MSSDSLERVASMIPHNGPFILVLTLTIIDNLQTASLNGEGDDQAWAVEHSDQVHTVGSLLWTSQISRANMDSTTPQISFFSDDTDNSVKIKNALKDTLVSNAKSGSNNDSANEAFIETWSDNTNSIKSDKTLNSATPSHSSETTLLTQLRSSHPVSQARSKGFVPPDYTVTPGPTQFHVSKISTYQERPKVNPTWVVGKSKSTTQRPDAALEQGQTHQQTTVKDNQRMTEEFTKKSPQEIAVLTSSPKDSLKKRPASDKVHGDPFDEEGGQGSLKEDGNMEQTVRPTSALTSHTRSPGLLALDYWNTNDFRESPSLPDCNTDATGVCNSSNPLWSHDLPDNNLSSALAHASPMPPPGNMSPPPVATIPPLLVPLFSDWNAAMSTWGLAWELQVYGLGCVFSLVAMLSALNLLCLPLCQPSGCASFSFLHLLQLLVGSSRAFWLLYDPYGQKERLPVAWARLLHEVAYPCLTGAFGLLLLLLTPHILSQNALRRCFYILVALMLVHVTLVIGVVGILWLFPSLPVISLLPHAAFLLLSCLFSFSYLLFYCYAHADANHIYRLKENSPDHLACHANHCPLAEAGVWERIAGIGLFSALFLLACGGLRLYAILHAAGLIDGGTRKLMPWPWWAFHVSCRVCEACFCLSLALILTHPLLCCGVAHPKPGCWSSCFSRSSTGRTGLAKPQILASGWTKKSGESLGLQGGMTRHESESVPLYTLAELPVGESDGLDLHYPSSPQHLAQSQNSKSPPNCHLVSLPSFISLDSTADLRPPSPIDLRRSIDEALNSEVLFHHSLFSSSRLSLSTRGLPDGQPSRVTPAEASLYRTASCGDVNLPSAPSPATQRSSTTWKPSNSRSLYGGNRKHGGHVAFYSGFGSGSCSQKQYKALRSMSSRERVCDQQRARTQSDELAVQAEFISVCRQIDALSISSDTIEL